MATLPTLAQLEQAIFSEEGGTNAAGYASNNPADLMNTSGELQSFSSLTEGETALTGYLQNAASGANQNYYPGESLGEFETTYTGGDPNAAQNLSSLLGGVNTETTTLGSIVNNTGYTGAETLPSLPEETPLGIGEGPATTGTVDISPSGAVTTTGVNGSQTAQASTSTSWITSIENWLSAAVPREVAILVGVILIAGAVFGFHEISTTVVQGVKKGAALSV